MIRYPLSHVTGRVTVLKGCKSNKSFEIEWNWEGESYVLSADTFFKITIYLFLMARKG